MDAVLQCDSGKLPTNQFCIARQVPQFHFYHYTKHGPSVLLGVFACLEFGFFFFYVSIFFLVKYSH